jgi:hypothetical protein
MVYKLSIGTGIEKETIEIQSMNHQNLRIELLEFGINSYLKDKSKQSSLDVFIKKFDSFVLKIKY